jgi:anaerobic magnesium-protoporphyrin IX monomethyl ester cyclase
MEDIKERVKKVGIEEPIKMDKVVTLVRVPNLFAGGALTLSATPPIGLAYLASSLRVTGYDVKIIDSIGEAIEKVYSFAGRNLYVNGLAIEDILKSIPKNSKYIGVSLPFSHEWPLARKICLAIKERFPNSLLIVGGEHATALPDFCLQNCHAIDYCVLGEGEETFRELIDSLATKRSVDDVAGLALRGDDGGTIFTKNRARILSIDAISPPAWDLVPLENYLTGGYSFGVNIGRAIPILATRGCPFKCTFCSNPKMWKTHWLARSPSKVVEEMEEYIRRYSIENFDFYDLTAIVRKDWIVEFCNLLIKRRLNITWQLPSGTRTEVLDNMVTELLYKAGCRNISYAPESGSPLTLKRIKKKINIDTMIRSMKASISNNINIKANVIIGFPDETLKNIIETYKFIIRMAITGVHDVSVWTFSAYPGSEIFDDFRKKNIINSEFTDDYFTSLLSYSDLSRAVSWNINFSNKQLNYLRYLGLILFYFVSYVLRPFRLIRNILNIVRHKPKSRLEMIVLKALSRHKKA